MLDFARPGDTSVVWRLDRLGRSLKHLIETVMGLQTCEINFRSLVVSSDDQLQGPLLRSSELTAIIYWMYRSGAEIILYNDRADRHDDARWETHLSSYGSAGRV